MQESKYERANRNLMEAESVLREKDEDLKVVQREFDAVMEERQVIYEIYVEKNSSRSAINSILFFLRPYGSLFNLSSYITSPLPIFDHSSVSFLSCLFLSYKIPSDQISVIRK